MTQDTISSLTPADINAYQASVNVWRECNQSAITYSSTWGEDYTKFFNAVANHDYAEYMRLVNTIDLFKLTAHKESVAHIAITHNNIYVLEDLMGRLSDEQKIKLLNITNSAGQTALTLAAHLRRNDHVALLLNNGVTPLDKDANEDTAADYALITNNLKLFQLMEEACPELKSKVADISIAYGKCASYLQGPERFKANGDLLQAIQNKDIVALRVAIASGANVNTHQGTRRGPPLIRALDADCPIEFIQELTNAGASANITNAKRQTPLMKAFEKDRMDVANLFLQQPNIDLSLTDMHEDSALDYAPTNDLKLMVLDKLLEKNSSIKHVRHLLILSSIIEEELGNDYNLAQKSFQARMDATCTKENEFMPPIPRLGFATSLFNLQGIAQEGIKILSDRGTEEAQKRMCIVQRAHDVLNRTHKDYQYTRI